MKCGVCQIGVMTGYRQERIRFELWCVLDCVMTGYRLERIRFELRCVSDCVMTGYRLERIRFELRCVSYWCDDWLQVGENKI